MWTINVGLCTGGAGWISALFPPYPALLRIEKISPVNRTKKRESVRGGAGVMRRSSTSSIFSKNTAALGLKRKR
jgi:hypothetical protein